MQLVKTVQPGNTAKLPGLVPGLENVVRVTSVLKDLVCVNKPSVPSDLRFVRTCRSVQRRVRCGTLLQGKFIASAFNFILKFDGVTWMYILSR